MGFSVNRMPLQRKILVLFISLITIVALFAAFFFPSKQKKQLVKNFEKVLVTIADAISTGVTIGLESGDLSAAEKAMNFAKNEPEIRYVALVSSGEILATYPKGIAVDLTEASSDTLLITKSQLKTNALEGEIIIGCSTQKIQSSIHSIQYTALIFAVFAIGISTLLATFLGKKIINPIIILKEAAEKLSSGDMNSRVNINTHDEIEDLGETFNLMAENLQKLMEEVHSAKANVEKQVEEAVAKAENERHYLATSVDGLLAHINRFAQGDLTTTMRFQDRGDIISNLFHGINNAIAQTHNAMLKVTEVVKAVSGAVGTITVNTEELTSGASQQAMQTLEVSSAIEEMSNTISENATNALAASKIAEQSGSRATAGGKTVAEAIKEINKIAEVVNKSAQTVQSLNNSSTQIGDIIEVINEIADQTNLLALNAAIEAARAGEQGRGFTVVADEVRKLSERTTYSTQEIANKIQQMQNDTQSAVDAMHHATEEVNQGKSLIDQAGVSLNEIINDSENVIEVIAQVATASEEQASTSTQISQNVDAIHTITQRQSENSQKIADLTKELNILMTELNNVVDNFQLDAASIPVSGDFISQGSRVKDMQNTNSKKETFVFD